MGKRKKCKTPTSNQKRTCIEALYNPESPLKSLLSDESLRMLNDINTTGPSTPNGKATNNNSSKAQFLTPNTLQSTIAPIITRTFLNDYYKKKEPNSKSVDIPDDGVIVLSDIDSTPAEEASDNTIIYVAEDTFIDLSDSLPGPSRTSSIGDDSVICLLDDTQLEIHKNQLPSRSKKQSADTEKPKEPNQKQIASDESIIIIDDDDDDNTSKENATSCNTIPALALAGKPYNMRNKRPKVLERIKTKVTGLDAFNNTKYAKMLSSIKDTNLTRANTTPKPKPKVIGKSLSPIKRALFNYAKCSPKKKNTSHTMTDNRVNSCENKTNFDSKSATVAKSTETTVINGDSNSTKAMLTQPAAAIANKAVEYYSLDVNSNNSASNALNNLNKVVQPESDYQKTIERYSVGVSQTIDLNVPSSSTNSCSCPPYMSVFCNQCQERKSRPNTRSQQNQNISLQLNVVPPLNVRSNIYNATGKPISRTGLRPIIIDGSNVAMQHSHGKSYSVERLKVCIDYFLLRGHQVKAFVPQFRLSPLQCTNPNLLDWLARSGYVIFTPSRKCDNRLIVPYDDRYIIQCATEYEGIVVSNDNYRDLLKENPKWRDTIENRILMFTWVDDMLMFPTDPLGRNGPVLDEFLRYPVHRNRY